MLPAILTEEEYEAVKSKAWFSSGFSGRGWTLSQADVMAVLNCGLSKAARIRAQALDKLKRDHPQGIPKPVDGQDPGKEPVLA